MVLKQRHRRSMVVTSGRKDVLKSPLQSDVLTAGAQIMLKVNRTCIEDKVTH